MNAYSTKTGKSYPSWDALVDAEAYGWTVVTIMQKVTAKRVQTFARTNGLYTGVTGQREARKGAARTRSRFKAAQKRGDVPDNIGLLTISIEPVWEEKDVLGGG